MSNNRIKYALHLEGWNFENGNVSELLRTAKKILPSEFQKSMLGNIFCPACKTNLSRSPIEKPNFSNSRDACFVHLPRYSEIECDLRTKKPEGLKFLSEELALQAISDDQLAIVNSFMEKAPDSKPGADDTYEQSAVEDTNGPTSEIPISRYKGEFFKLPSKIATVTGICRSFDTNLYKYYILPGSASASRLVDILINIEDITEVNETPKLYWGEIISSHNAGITPKPSNIRMTKLRSNRGIKDFHLKTRDYLQTEKGISDQSNGRIVIFWGKITWNGIGLCVENLGWGEFALLPKKYDALLKN